MDDLNELDEQNELSEPTEPRPTLNGQWPKNTWFQRKLQTVRIRRAHEELYR